jgi:hypothetical protein
MPPASRPPPLAHVPRDPLEPDQGMVPEDVTPADLERDPAAILADQDGLERGARSLGVSGVEARPDGACALVGDDVDETEAVRLVPGISRDPLARAIQRGETALEVEREHDVARVLEQLAVPLLARELRLFRAPPLQAMLRLAQLAVHDGQQPRELALHDEVAGAGAHQLDGAILGNLAGDDDEGDVAAAGLERPQGLEAAEPRQVVIGDDEIPALAAERGFHGVGRLDAEDLRVVASAPELPLERRDVGLRVLDEEHPHGAPRRHGAADRRPRA